MQDAKEHNFNSILGIFLNIDALLNPEILNEKLQIYLV
jgi:hypothetical protein